MDELLRMHLTLSEYSRNALENLPQSFLEPLTTKQLHLVASSFVALDVAKRGTMAPETFQLEVMLSVLSRRDCVVGAAAGEGKTLAMILPQLLYPDHVVITVSPFVELHKEQANELNEYGILSIAIDKTTTFTYELSEDLCSGKFKHIIASPEQLSIVPGMITDLGRLLRERTFTRFVKHLNVDEYHIIKVGREASTSEPSYLQGNGKLSDLRKSLGPLVSLAAFSASMAAEVVQEVMTDLMKESNTDIIRPSTNYSHLTYGVIKMIGSFKDFADVRFVIPGELGPSATLEEIPKGIIFTEDLFNTVGMATYLNDSLPETLSSLRPIRHLHLSMSREYVSQTVNEFANPNGKVRILVATRDAAHRINVRNIAFVLSYGVPQTLLELEQLVDHCRRDGKTPGFAIVMAEPWIYEERDPGAALTNFGSNGMPVSLQRLIERERQGEDMPILDFCRTKDCKRRFLSRFNHDFSALALGHSGAMCCDSPEHTTNFEEILCNFFKSELAKDVPLAGPDNEVREERPEAQRPELRKRLKAWLRNVHEEDEVYSGFPVGYILSLKGLESLVTAQPNMFKSSDDLKEHLEETDEWVDDWGEGFLNVIKNYDDELAVEAIRPDQDK